MEAFKIVVDGQFIGCVLVFSDIATDDYFACSVLKPIFKDFESFVIESHSIDKSLVTGQTE